MEKCTIALRQYAMRPSGKYRLACTIPAGTLGFTPEKVWSPSPSYHHRTDAYDLPKNITIGLKDTEESAARFSPPPFAVVVSGHGRKICAGVMAPRGRHAWTAACFRTSAAGLKIRLEFDGNIPPSSAARGTKVFVLPGHSGEANPELLGRAMSLAYPAVPRATERIPAWWRRPIYCGYGDQVGISLTQEGAGPEARAMAYCIQGLYERWLGILDVASVPIGTVIIDAGWSMGGLWKPYPLQWPDLRGFTLRQHRKGRRVLLWLGAWLQEGLPDEWCIHSDNRRLTVDPFHPGYRAYVRKQVTKLLSRSGFNADGFKIDQLQAVPTRRDVNEAVHFGRISRLPRSRQTIKGNSDVRGCELLRELQRLIYDAAKNAKADALITSSTVHPIFAGTLDMVRLHDTGYVDPKTDVFAAMKARADLAQAALPGVLIDTDNWVHTYYQKWLDYTLNSYRLGVPCLFYAERFVRLIPKWEAIPLRIDDLKDIGKSWKKHLG